MGLSNVKALHSMHWSRWIRFIDFQSARVAMGYMRLVEEPLNELTGC